MGLTPHQVQAAGDHLEYYLANWRHLMMDKAFPKYRSLPARVQKNYILSAVEHRQILSLRLQLFFTWSSLLACPWLLAMRSH